MTALAGHVAEAIAAGGAAEGAPGATPARGAGAGEISLFFGAREEGRCLPVSCFSASKAALTGLSVSIAVVLKTLNFDLKLILKFDFLNVN